ncbi:MAG: high frequency lysogenization protein HflD [gamma proteobacterium symbiont of Bathyaustriella thionipta]|nr:high frequency lysogenization protein HflD [gamma proteobacterium symbiont of Bathyaustriella thionipta]
MSHSPSERTLALAGLFQCVKLVRASATGHSMDDAALQTCLHSLFVFDSDTLEDIYAGTENLQVGLQCLAEQLSGKAERDIEITRMVISLMHLSVKFQKNSRMKQQLHDELQGIQAKLQQFELSSTVISAQLAEVYSHTISTLSPRIMVKGEANLLQQANRINQIRALLLAGIRSAMLWHQLGGSRLQILFGRKKLLHEIEHLSRKY